MRKLLHIIPVLAVFAASCSSVDAHRDLEDDLSVKDLSAGFGETTRTYVEEYKYLRWHEDDRLTAFYGNTLNRQYKFNGQTGDNSGTFSLVPSGELGTGNLFDRIYALYPYDETARITEEGVISFTLPDVQEYLYRSFGDKANTMLAVTENIEDTFLAFRNVCGYLKLKLYSTTDVTVKTITLSGNNHELLAGPAVATIGFGEAPELELSETATHTITLDCGEVGVKLSKDADAPTEFLIVVPPVEFTEGLTVTVTDINKSEFVKSTGNQVVITRNEIQPMKTLEVKLIRPQAANELWYTNGSTTQPLTPNQYRLPSVQSHVFDPQLNRWVMTFTSDLITIGEKAFSSCSSLTSISFPHTLTKIDDYAFMGCDLLEEVVIPDNVTEIGHYSFQCSNLRKVVLGRSVNKIGEAFKSSKLVEIYCLPETPPRIYFFIGMSRSYSFPFNSGMKIYVPRSSYDSYMESDALHEGAGQAYLDSHHSKDNWFSYEKYIVPYSFE
jgi:hypothetical protein